MIAGGLQGQGDSLSTRINARYFTPIIGACTVFDGHIPVAIALVPGPLLAVCDGYTPEFQAPAVKSEVKSGITVADFHHTTDDRSFHITHVLARVYKQRLACRALRQVF